MNRFKQLINCHSHSHYSLDGAATVEQIIKRNLELGAPYTALTEHGHLNSAMELYTLSQKLGAKPILGIEAYLEHPFKDHLRKILEKTIPDDEFGKSRKKTKAEKIEDKLADAYVHLTIHFKDMLAYQYFCQLTPKMEQRAVVKYGERKPILTLDELAGISGHVTIGSGCIISAVNKFLVPDRITKEVYPELSRKMYEQIREIAGKGNYFVEIMPHKATHDWKRPEINKETGLMIPGQFVKNECTHWNPDGDLQKKCNLCMLALARHYKDPVIISLDSHFATPEQYGVQSARLSNGKEAWRFHTSYHIGSTDSYADMLKETLNATDYEIEEWVDNSYQWASNFDNFKIETNKDKWHLEVAPVDYMAQLKVKIDRYGRMDWSNKEMIERLKKEVDILSNNGKINLLSYFFTVEDIANFCKDNDILMNVRGSAGGSLLLYLLGVSAVNPLKYDLSFERFLTNGRVLSNSMPDADIDVSAGERERVFKYLEEKYGDRFTRISIDTMLKIKSSIKDSERMELGAVRPETEKLCVSLPDEPQGVSSYDTLFGYTDDDGVHHQGLIETNTQLEKYAKENPKIWEIVVEMIGIARQKSVHPCGILIADTPVQNFCPIIYVGDTKATGYGPKMVEAAGGIKYDILGLNTLQDITNCLRSIKTRLGITINPWDLPHDVEVFNKFGRGETETVFQFDTVTVRPFLKDTKPATIDQLSNITALARPGTLDAPNGDGRTLAQVYVARVKGEPVQYIHEDLRPILSDTYGVQLFQEQSLRIFRDIGGMSYEEAETVRRAISKKDAKELDKAGRLLMEQCLKRGWTEEQARKLFDQIMASSKYSFNRSHSVSYAHVAYACMWLKTNYPLDWWKAVLDNADKTEIATKFWPYVKDFVEMPDIRHPSNGFAVKGNKLVAPISILNGVGEAAYKQLVESAPYTDLVDFVTKHLKPRNIKSDGRSAVNSGVVNKLVVAGIMDSFFEKGATIDSKLYELERIKSEVKGKNKIDQVSPEFIGVTALGEYMAKKELIDVYSDDLRPIMLPYRGGQTHGGKWYVAFGRMICKICNAEEFLDYKERAEKGFLTLLPQDSVFGAIAYVISEKTFQYKNKTKQATKLVLDIGGYFYEEVLWPDYEKNIAQSGFEGKPCLVWYDGSKRDRISVKTIVPLLDETEIKRYNIN